SNGSLSDYVDAFFEMPALGGGFVWDWRDQGLAEIDHQDRFYWAYGGHYGDEPNDANFNINGLVGPDGVPHPALREYRWAARPVTATLGADGHVIVENRRSFTDTRDLEFHWLLLRDGVRVEDGTLSPVVPPGETLTLDPFLSATPDDAAEWHLTVSWTLRDATDWAEAGHVVAWDQLTLKAPARPALPALNLGASQTPPFQSQTVRNGNLAVRFDPHGAISAISLGDEGVLASPMTACVWRAPTDNDGGKPGARPLFQNKTAEWVSYGLNDLQSSEVTSEAWAAPGGTVQSVARTWRGVNGHALAHQSRVQFSTDGLVFEETLIVPEAWQDLPRVGLRFEIAASFDQIEWFGLGPDESYPDRKGAQSFEVWHSTIAEQYHPYVRPQEYGAHDETRWARVLNAAGDGLQFTFPTPLSFTARPHHDVDLNQAETLAQLKTRETTEVHIDAAVRGLGTAACGPDALPQFRVGPGTYAFRWILNAVKAEA
ncbi:MAG: beta-galactosidase domain 4-containing protein, partial [Pseudomonadota bacterium]